MYPQAAKKAKKDKDFETPKKSEEFDFFTKETTTPSTAQVQTLPAGWGEKKVATPRTEARTEAPAATEPPEEDIEGKLD